MARHPLMVTDNPNVTGWDHETHYKDVDPNIPSGTHYPLRVFNSKSTGDLVIYPRLLKRDLAYECRGPFHGFTVSLSSPEEMITLSRRIFRVSLSEQAIIYIKPKFIYSSKKLENVEPKVRHCFYNEERRLRYFKLYAKHNCDLECLTNFTKKECGCVKFSGPSKHAISVHVLAPAQSNSDGNDLIFSLL